MPLSVGRIAIWTATLGGASFAAGFFGPILLAPGANQGPLLGIFITGPIGMLVGFGVGLAREYLGYTASPLEVLRGWRSGEASNTGLSLALRPVAMLLGGFLAVYGIAGLPGGGRGAASALVVAAAVIYYGVTGRAPRWFRR